MEDRLGSEASISECAARAGGDGAPIQHDGSRRGIVGHSWRRQQAHQSLEETFGISLLLRGARFAEPTPEGARLANDLSSAFALIASSVEQLQPGPLTLSCSSTIMMSWVIPRIGAFHKLPG